VWIAGGSSRVSQLSTDVGGFRDGRIRPKDSFGNGPLPPRDREH
jgi:hypothetical protein